MLKKEKMIPGSWIKTRSILKDGLGGTCGISQKSDELDALTLWSKPYAGGHDSTSQSIPSFIPKNTLIYVIKKPTKRNGINMATVEYSGHEGFVFWCELRVSCDHV